MRGNTAANITIVAQDSLSNDEKKKAALRCYGALLVCGTMADSNE